MRHIAWATDIHLDHLGGSAEIRAFAAELVSTQPEAVLLTGDITVANRLIVDLGTLVAALACPVYFTLGNHDYFGSSRAAVREVVRTLCIEHADLHYLPQSGLIELSESTALVGVDGWGDARCGAWESSRVRLSDFTLIDDLGVLPRGELTQALRDFGVVANRLIVDLGTLVAALACPVYFTLGNHDYFGSSRAAVREVVRTLCIEHADLHYLPQSGLIELSESTALLGVDGWGDARCGAWESSRVRLSDFTLIDDLGVLPRAELTQALRDFGDEEASRARSLLEQALPKYRRVVFATHVPPFEEACWYEGELPGPNDHWSPYFVCVAVGEVLREYAERFPHHELEVYCGHTHGAGASKITYNLAVTSADAEYGKPQRGATIPF